LGEERGGGENELEAERGTVGAETGHDISLLRTAAGPGHGPIAEWKLA
jgi:hypothetical protein